MSRILIIVDCYGEHRYPIVNETADFVETNSVTILDEYPLRFNKHEGRMEYFNGVAWDVYISESEILGVNTIGEKSV